MYLSMLRSSNLIPISHGLVDTQRQLTWKQIIRYDDGIVIRVTLSKTIQFSQRVHEVAIASSPNSTFCPVRALDKLIELRGADNCAGDSLVFAVPGAGERWVPLTKTVAAAMLEQQISGMGLDPAKYRFHGFRHGSLQAAVLVEPSLEIIRVQSDHLSDAIHAYTSLPGHKRFGVSTSLLARLNNNI